MNRKMILAVLAGSAAGIVIYLVTKRILENGERNKRQKENEEFKTKRKPKFSDAYGEYTL